jgi:hypothetical protein
MKPLQLMLSIGASLLCILSNAWAANVNIVHGIDGRDLGLARALPVDIAVNGSCVLKGVTFKKSALVELAPATYRITVHVADGACSQSPVISQNVTIDESPSFSLVASLTQTGTPQLSAFNNSRELAIPPTVSVRHLASAAPVSVKFSSPDLLKSQTKRIRNGKATNLSILTNRFNYTINIFSGKNNRTIAKLTGVETKSYSIYNIVGSAKNGFSIIRERLTP